MKTVRTAGYPPPPAKTIQIQDEDVGQIFRETDSASISASLNRVNRPQYNYREQVMIANTNTQKNPVELSKRQTLMRQIANFPVEKYSTKFASAS